MGVKVLRVLRPLRSINSVKGNYLLLTVQCNEEKIRTDLFICFVRSSCTDEFIARESASTRQCGSIFALHDRAVFYHRDATFQWDLCSPLQNYTSTSQWSMEYWYKCTKSMHNLHMPGNVIQNNTNTKIATAKTIKTLILSFLWLFLSLQLVLRWRSCKRPKFLIFWAAICNIFLWISNIWQHVVFDFHNLPSSHNGRLVKHLVCDDWRIRATVCLHLLYHPRSCRVKKHRKFKKSETKSYDVVWFLTIN